jgi:hypothetical protein
MGKIAIVFLLWGDWCKGHQIQYVKALRNMLERHVTIPFDLIGYTDNYEIIEDCGIQAQSIPADVLKWRLNLPKFWVHSPDSGLRGRRVFFFYLDTVLCNNIDKMLEYNGTLCGIKPFKPGKTHMGGGFLSFAGYENESRLLWDAVSSDPKGWAERTQGGKERLVIRALIDKKEYWQDLYPGELISFKRHMLRGRKNPPKSVSIVAFHGHPRIHEVSDNKWVRRYWK